MKEIPDLRRIARVNASLQIAGAILGGLGVALIVGSNAFFFRDLTDFSFGSVAAIVLFGLITMAALILMLQQFRDAIMVLFDEVGMPELWNMAFLILWLGILWFAHKVGEILALYGNVDEYLRSGFQLLFVITMVGPVVVFIVQEMVYIVLRIWRVNKREDALS